MVIQKEIVLQPLSRGFHIITDRIIDALPDLPQTGLLNIFCKHTSCGLLVSESWDGDVRTDLSTVFDKLAPENDSDYSHILEGADDMPSHAKSVLTGSSLDIPITNHHLNLGTWQGIQIGEFRNFGNARRLVLTVIGE